MKVFLKEIDTMPSSKPNSETNNEQKTSETKEQTTPEKPKLTLGMFFDPSQPWVLVKGGSFLNLFDFVPHHYRHGPWSMPALLGLPTLMYLLAVGAIWVDQEKPAEGWWTDDMLTLSYEAYTWEWYYTVSAFGWMTYICWNVYAKSPLHGSAWISFTLWSWTLMTLRHGLCVLAPFVVSSGESSMVILLAEMLRFPCLLSASMTFFIWNFVLFPVILVFFIRDATKRWQFFGYMTNFRLTQLHFFNIWFAVSNGALISPMRTLHLGDLVVAVTMIVVYMCWYYFVLDRLGIHLYPIFTPRSSFVVLAWGLILVVCVGGYHFWKNVLESLISADGDGGLIHNSFYLLGYALN
jgi:hypothetical protein